jgi:hypothetical protein
MGELGEYSPETTGLTVLEDSRAGAASHAVAHPGTPAPVLRNTKSCNKHMALSPSWGPVFVTSAVVVSGHKMHIFITNIPIFHARYRR